MTGIRPRLEALARLHGITIEYADANGLQRIATDGALRATLVALGTDSTTLDDPSAAIERRRHALWSRPVDPIVVAWDGSGARLRVRCPADRQRPHASVVTAELLHEQGEHFELALRLDEQTIVDRETIGLHAYEAHDLRLPELPVGRHELRVVFGDEQHRVTVLSAPARFFDLQQPPRRSSFNQQAPVGGTDSGGAGRSGPLWLGLFAPVYALRSGNADGGGHLGQLRALIRGCGELGCGLFGTLPLLAAFLDEPFDPSPYTPVSRQFWNELFVDVADSPELDRSSAARELLSSTGFVNSMRALDAAPLVEYRELMALRRTVLERLATTFWEAGGSRRDAFESWLAATPGAGSYALFRSIAEQQRCGWQDWPASLRTSERASPPCDDLLGAAAAEGDERLAPARRYHLYAQWLFDQQIARLGAEAAEQGPGLVLDLPLGSHPNGYDTWSEPALFAHGTSAGCPPDPLCSRGQSWGVPPLIPERLREDGYRHVSRCLAHQMRHAGVLRVDHVMQLSRLFWIPPGMNAEDGVYVRYPAEELLAVISLASHDHRCAVVGEDLGIVEDDVREAMRRHGLLRTYVAQLELIDDESSPLPDPPADAVACVNTHDLPTFAGFLAGRDIDDREERGLLATDAAQQERCGRARARARLTELLRRERLIPESGRHGPAGETGGDGIALLSATLRHLARGPARVVMLGLADLLGETEPQNTPGTVFERPNWQRKLTLTVEGLLEDGLLADVLAALRR